MNFSQDFQKTFCYLWKVNKVEVRNLQIEDYIQLSQSFKRVYADKDVFWADEEEEK